MAPACGAPILVTTGNSQPCAVKAMIGGMGNEPAGFGGLLRRFRIAAGLSQEALAERAGLSMDAIAALE